jgi:hypothetical protein
MLVILEYISNATGIDNSDIRKLFIYEYTVMTLPIVILSEVLTNKTIEIIKNIDRIKVATDQFLPCNVDS